MQRSLVQLVVAAVVLIQITVMFIEEGKAGAVKSSGAVFPPAVPAAKSKPPAESSTKDPDLTEADAVAFSSRLIAAARAIESRRSDRLFNDPFAELLAGPEAMRKAEKRLSPPLEPAEVSENENRSGSSAEVTAALQKEHHMSSRRLAIRTRFCDDFFENCAWARGIKQIVSLGSGMDTRGLRLRAPSDTTVFDVDQAVVLRVKNGLLERAGAIEMNEKERQQGAARARIVTVEADLRQAGWEGELFEAGFDPALPSAWILEGLTMYLEEQEVIDLIRVLGNLCAPGSAFCATCVSMESVARGKESKSQAKNAWKWGCDDPQAFFDSHFPPGWSFEHIPLGTPGEFPTGADYSVGFKAKHTAYVLGYSSREGPP